ncbi:MAG TPA: ABC transporter permease [Trebonia sp.]|jgi:peptide/nickel transport system permease protein|nr:ABC transporter permease [Trebonia sp.]
MTASKSLTGSEPGRGPGEAPGITTPEAGEITRTAPPLRVALATLTANRTALAGIIIIVLMLGFSFIGPLFYHTNQISTNLPASLRPPGGAHPLGTDNEGYDVLGRLMIAGQSSLEVGLAAAVVATMIGVFYGAISGFAGGLLDGVMMRLVDGLLSIPTIFLLIFLFTVYSASTLLLVLVIGLVAWLVPARLIRAETLSLRTREYVQAVRVVGGTRRRMIIRHIIPNAIGTIMVNATFQVADAILALASLGFLGLGVQPPATNWGAMLSTGVNYVYAGDWWLIYPAGVAILLTVMAFNAVGDGLRDVFEVRLKRR